MMRFSRETNSSNRENLFAWKRRSLSKKKKKEKKHHDISDRIRKNSYRTSENELIISLESGENVEPKSPMASRIAYASLQYRTARKTCTRRAYVVSNVLELN